MYPYANRFSVKKVSENGDVLIKASQEIGSFDEKGEMIGASASEVATIIVCAATAQELGMALLELEREGGDDASSNTAE